MTVQRPVQPQDLEELGDLLDSIFRIPRGVTDQHMLTDFPLLFRPENLQNCRVIVEDGKIVSHAGLWPRQLVIDQKTLKVGILVAVATHPEYRRRGQAATLVKSLQGTLHDDGFDLGILWTGVPDFYQNLGWQIVRPQGHLVELTAADRFREKNAADCEIVPYSTMDQLQELTRIHELETNRMTRTADELSTLVSLPKVSTSFAVSAGQAVAYLVTSHAVNKPGWIECGGACEGITALLNHSLHTDPPETSARWLIAPTRSDLVAAARNAGLPVQPIGSSKGMPKANEMILNCRPDFVARELIDHLFVWGLDLA